MDHPRSEGAIWLSGHPSDARPLLVGRVRYDVAVVGGGITGLTAATLLKQLGRRVVVLESGRVGQGTTGGTSAHLTTELERGYVDLTRGFGDEVIRRVVEGRREAIDIIARLVERHGIVCGFARVDGWSYAADRGQRRKLLRELEAIRRVDDEARWVEETPSVDSNGAVLFPRQGIFQPADYLRGLASVVHGARGASRRALPRPDAPR